MLTPVEVREGRTAICLACPHLRKSFIFTCKLCGCAIRGKVTVASSECPAMKWGKYHGHHQDLNKTS